MVACLAAPVAPTVIPAPVASPTPANPLLGKWYKVQIGTPVATNDPSAVTIIDTCDLAYPPSLEFGNDGTYKGDVTTAIINVFIWPGGAYEMLAADRVKIQTQDGYGEYQLAFDGEKITVHDNANCEIKYQRAW